MPRRDIWIRKEDLSIWNALESRADWLHEALNKKKEASLQKIKLPQFKEPIYVPRANNECPNHHALDEFGFCFGKGCKYNR